VLNKRLEAIADYPAAAIKETIRLMTEIDKAIPKWPIE
jgi:hypothetical protein